MKYVEKIEERLNLRVDEETRKHEQLEEQLEVVSHKLHGLAEQTSADIESPKVEAVQEKVEQEKITPMQEGLKILIDPTTKYAPNFRQQHNIITLHQE
jgi:archaellum component FlaC